MALEGHKKIETNATLLLTLSFLAVTVGVKAHRPRSGACGRAVFG